MKSIATIQILGFIGLLLVVSFIWLVQDRIFHFVLDLLAAICMLHANRIWKLRSESWDLFTLHIGLVQEESWSLVDWIRRWWFRWWLRWPQVHIWSGFLMWISMFLMVQQETRFGISFYNWGGVQNGLSCHTKMCVASMVGRGCVRPHPWWALSLN